MPIISPLPLKAKERLTMLSELIASAKAGDKNSMLHLIEKFSPIIKKYGYKLDPDDGISEITLFLLS